MYSYGHPGSSSLAAIGNKEAHMFYGSMNIETRSSQAAGEGRRFLPRQLVLLVKFKDQTESLRDVTSKEKKTYLFLPLSIMLVSLTNTLGDLLLQIVDLVFVGRVPVEQ